MIESKRFDDSVGKLMVQYGSLGMILDHFSRICQRYTARYVPVTCHGLVVVPTAYRMLTSGACNPPLAIYLILCPIHVFRPLPPTPPSCPLLLLPPLPSQHETVLWPRSEPIIDCYRL